MKSRMLGLTRNICASLAIMLATVATPAILAAEAVAPNAAAATANAPTQEPLEELDQIVVRGESLVKAINDAEDDFFKLYNSLNKDDDYDTSCVYLALQTASLIKTRTCIPGFLADAIADQVYFAEQCKAPQDEAGNQLSPAPCYTPPPLQSLLGARTDAFAGHLMTMIKSDPRLGQKAGHLDDLLFELASVQKKYTRVRADAQPAKTDRRETGPRLR